MLITDRQSINDEFHSVLQEIYSKQEVDNSSEAIQEFLDSDGDTKPSEYLKSKALTYEKINGIVGEWNSWRRRDISTFYHHQIG